MRENYEGKKFDWPGIDKYKNQNFWYYDSFVLHFYIFLVKYLKNIHIFSCHLFSQTWNLWIFIHASYKNITARECAS